MCQPDLEPNTESPGSSPFAQQLRIPQFGILHLMIWSAVTALLLKCLLALQDESMFRNSPGQLWAVRITQAFYAIATASVLVGAGVLLRARCCRMLRALQPGHWLVLITAFGALLGLLAWSIYRFIPTESPLHQWVYLFFETGTNAVTFALWIVATKKVCDALRWKVFLGAEAAAEALAVLLGFAKLAASVLLHSSYSFSLYQCDNWLRLSQALFLIFVVVNAIADLSSRVSRDWVHWLGIAVFAVTTVISLGWQTYYVFFYRPGM